MKRIFGTDGIRGIAGEFLTAELAGKVGASLCEVLHRKGGRKILIGTDTRESAGMLERGLSEGITAMGFDAVLLGVVPTPAVAYLTASTDAAAGVMISASHNSYEYNGIKIFGADGFKLTDAEEEEIERLIYQNSFTPKVRRGSVLYGKRLIKNYVSHLKKNVPESLSGIKVAFDCANGSASAVAGEIFGSLGCECHFIGCEADGVNINRACGSTHLEALKSFVTQNGMDIGLAFDGDADRCLAVDECGNEVDGDRIMAILALSLLEKGRLSKNPVVGTVMSNYGFQTFCRERGLSFVGTRVGDRYVLEEIERCGYSLGGEQSGHVIIRELMTTGDGELTGLLLLCRMRESGKKLSELASVMKKCPQSMVNISANEREKAALSQNPEIKSIIKAAEGMLGNSGRILVRPSGTEPLVRIMVESTDPTKTVKLCESVAAKISEIFKNDC